MASRSRLEKLFESEWKIVGLMRCDPSSEIGNCLWIFLGLCQTLLCKRDGGNDARAD